ncbi:MAG: hypothetical protein U0350_02020 [Caldilineaceae bacterium]
MKQVAPLRYDVIFKKAFCDPAIFTAFVQAVANVTIQIDKVETEKSFKPPIGRVASRFDLFAEDVKNRVIVDIQHVRYPDHYAAFLHYHCAAILEQVAKAENYRPNLAVYSIVVLTSGDKHGVDVATIDFDPKTRMNKGLGEIPHKVFYLCPKYANAETPPALREWLRAIDDTLDEQVEERDYQHPQIRRIFDLIVQDAISPEERARMFEEYNREQLKQDELEQQKRTIASSLLAQGIDVTVIAMATGLSAEEIAALTRV